MKKYLLIDDDEIFNFLHSEIIKQSDSDSQIITFNSSIEALDYIKKIITDNECLPDYFFIDIRMPEMNGFELLDELMKYPKEFFEHTKIYFVTSSLDKRDQVKASNYPIVTGFKEKSITSDSLKDM